MFERWGAAPRVRHVAGACGRAAVQFTAAALALANTVKRYYPIRYIYKSGLSDKMISPKNPQQVKAGIKTRMREKRLSCDLTQEGLADRAGVSLGTLKRFEATGDIALETLLKLSLVLDGLDDFDKVMSERAVLPSRAELLAEPKQRKRGRRK